MKGIYWRTLTFKKKCDLPNKSKSNIVQVHAVQQYMDVPNRRCPLCDFKGTHLKAHWTEKHKDDPLPVFCDKCDARFVTRQELMYQRTFTEA